MAFTRAQASGLLNKSEMKLFDDSRANALRGLDRAALAGRVERTRAARDRARDLLKRQRLAARKRGEGKADTIAARTARKEALLAEILQRFAEARRNAPAKVVKKATAKRAIAKKAPANKGAGMTASRKAAVRKTATRKTAAKTSVAKKSTAKKAVAKKAAPAISTVKKAAPARQPARKADAAGRPAKKAASKKTPAKRSASRRRVSPERALEATRSLLEAKHERDRTPQPWQSLDPVADHVPQPGYQSPQAASKARELHAGEARLVPIHGSISTRDRRNQGKRDHRNGDSD
ncbi:hypothetical protein [Luteimonas terricola]|uniref:Uncharacterized protein n=1 Tax=Luteimonas terricola TaxID=645597 RepID=A0ABQ2EDQ5_9GAMM|nr:hypothetical protein [Luteimonas terricola]GGK08165.1 hypothetical protein GCM10011394_16890 [Luteimonas terricola]